MVQEAAPTQELPSPTEVAEVQATSEEAAEVLPAAEEVAQPEPETPFATIRDPYEVLEHPEVKPLIERLTRRNEERLTSEWEQRQQQETRNWEATETFKTINGITGRILEQLGEGNVDVPERLIGRLEALSKPFEPEYQQHFQRVGMAMTFDAAMVALKDGLDMRRQDELDDIRQRKGATWADLVSARVKMGMESEREIGRKEGRDEGRKAALNDVATKERAKPENNPDLAPKGGSSDDINQARRDYADGKITTARAKELGIV